MVASMFMHVMYSMQALEMFTSLRMFDEAKHWAEEAARGGKGGPAGDAAGAARVADLIGRQAQWSEETANYEAAVEMYIKVSKGAWGWAFGQGFGKICCALAEP